MDARFPLDGRNPFHILGLSVDATKTDIMPAFGRAMKAAPGDAAWARTELLDEETRQEWEIRMLNIGEWLDQLQTIQHRYALVDYLASWRS